MVQRLLTRTQNVSRTRNVSRAKRTRVQRKLNDGLQRSLVQPGSAESFQIVLAVGVLPHRQIFCDPGERDIGLRAAQLLERSRGDIMLSGHAGGGGQHTMPADEIVARPDRFVREPMVGPRVFAVGLNRG